MALIAGPCVIESAAAAYDLAAALKEITAKLDIPFIFKASFDKANRSSLRSYRGPGVKRGLKILARIKRGLNIPVLSDVHCPGDVEPAQDVLDIIQVPAFLCRQTDLLLAAGRAKKAVNVKKGQFMAPGDMKNVVEKIASTGNRRIILTERGACFGYNNLVSDLRSLAIMRGLGCPVVYDATHSVQRPAGCGSASGGDREFVVGLSRAAVAFGCDGLFLEVHPRPDKALCDGPNSLALSALEGLLRDVKAIENLSGRGPV